MATKLDPMTLGKIYRKATGEYGLDLIRIANENIGKPVQEMLPLLAEVDAKIAVKITSEVIRELARMGVDLEPVWKTLEANGLAEWAKDQNGLK
jgi:hypothetical protein